MSQPEAGSPGTGGHRLLAEQVEHPKSPAHSYASTTLRSTTSGHSIRTNSTTICESPGAGDPFSYSACSSSSDDDDEGVDALERCLRGAANDLGDAGLRYSFKGPPPELYSPKKDFISSGPLLDRQLVLKKRCEWWFYSCKCSQKMSTHWRQHACVYACSIAFLLAMLIIFYGVPSAHKAARLELPQSSHSENHTHNHNQSLPHPTVITMPAPPVTLHPRNFDNDTQTEPGEADGFEDLGEEDHSTFVTPTKVYNYSLSEGDLLYESKRNSDLNSFLKDSSTAFSMTGTYRNRTNEIWDPHPEYNLNVFGRQLHLVLRQDASFVQNHTLQLDQDGEQDQEADSEPEQHHLGCHYTGHVDGDPQSVVAVSLCSGMTGYIKTSFGALLIEPYNRTSNDEVLHRVWRKSQRNARQAVSSLELGLDALVSQVERELRKPEAPKLTRRKRHYTEVDNQLYTVEVLIAVDSSMVRFHGDDLKPYILILLSIVSSIFGDASIGNSIRISLVKLIVLPQTNDQHKSSNDMLRRFCTYINQYGYQRDTAMLITREPICGSVPGKICHMLGLAELGTVCSDRSCSIVQDTGLPTAFTMAHELGHILSMNHDDDDKCVPYVTRHNNNKQLHIMSSVMGIHMHPWSWSKCSRHFVSEFLEKTEKSCLETSVGEHIPYGTKRLPGEIYSLDNQCQLSFGNDFGYCPTDEECRRLWCKRSSGGPNEQCRSSNLPWADGTPCGNSGHWCQKGRCVSNKHGYGRKVNGGWGPWTPYTPCSLTCGGGVQESRRECNHPVPEHDGKYCTGSRKKYRSCNTHQCPEGSMDPREQQCYDMNGRDMNIPGVNPATKWVPKYQKDACKLFCRIDKKVTYFMLKSKVTDGTSCAVDSFDKCVNGICRPAGCDNELNSIAKLDKCGVCEGRNDTCHEITGNLLVSHLRGLNDGNDPNKTTYYVTTIPKGASNIMITQPGYPEQNFIVLSDDRQKNLLNGEMVKTYPLNFVYAGVTMQYSGSSSPVEQVNTTYSWKLSRDLIVQIISLDVSSAVRQDAVLMSYSYTIDKPPTLEAEVEIYRWEMQAPTNCDSLCEGRSHRQPACISTTQGLKVAPQFCDKSAMPKVEERACNTECRLNLTVTSISECSAACGELGTREKTFNCIQTFPNMQRSNIVDMSYCKLKFDVAHHEECREGCWMLSEWSSCSKSCGTGSRQREAHCYLHNSRVSDDLCNPRTKPQLSSLIDFCNTKPCPTYTESPNAIALSSWVTGEWGECNEWCEKSRSVSCANPYGTGCESRKPKDVRKCCHIKYTSEWTQCSVQCGEGQKWKKQRCTRVYKPEVPGTPKRRVYIDESYCVSRNIRRPKLRTTTKTCRINCKWNASDWSRCPADCSEDYQTRYVRCESWQGDSVEEGHCDAKKRPSKRRICSNCMRRQSKVISQCNCDGVEKRRDICYNSHKVRIACPTRSKVERHRCTPPPQCRRRSAIGSSISSRPSNTNSIRSSSSSSSSSSSNSRSLNAISGLRSQGRPRSCADLQRMHGFNQDGNYQLEVRSRIVRVYCHQMNRAGPREYLNVDPQENYSIYYEYRTKQTNSCPPESRDHEYYNDQNSGRSHFSKLRLNITDLRILDNDFEFAETRGQPQKLGSAGDCYNRNGQCPQGDFSINLKSTDFTIRPGTVWTKHGRYSVMKRVSEFDKPSAMRRGFCGGYCGGCYIAPDSGLYLDVL
ncbi:A disintegrin and metalloproteinase with thrombospondin motifs 20 isoform X1 [Drosophila elegans]|uniref:A disintegrin and metalloproteinase with thrombospondin motifs 20 isoform X1 n=2 Tax=Drosophila elegans TaxID=30023 RepID=UPI0007E70F62|nr:A disintegrin and metalloproteinase with thrombospondin motifs 20 isoform X1 [Drosophila elegans]